MIDQYVGFFVTVILIAMVILVATLYLPLYGFMHKRFKGLVLGCLAQPFIFVGVLVLAVVISITYMSNDMSKYRKGAMVTIHTADKDSSGTKTHLYIGDEACFIEIGKLDKTDAYSVVFDNDREVGLFNVIYVGDSTICVDDKYLIKFDLKQRKAVATEYEDTIEIAQIDWEKVEAYFLQQNAK